MQDMQNIGYRPRGLSDAEYNALKTQAQGTGTYNITTANLAHAPQRPRVLRGQLPGPVLGQRVGVAEEHRLPRVVPARRQHQRGLRAKQRHHRGHRAQPRPVLPGRQHRSVPGGCHLRPGRHPEGQGGRNTIGTIYAKTVDLGGNIDFILDPCFANNPPGGVLNVEVTGFREDDSTDVN